MKLYANIKSERASKGQGGNKFLKIDLTMIDNKKQIVKFCTLYYGENEGSYSLGIDRGNGIAETILER